MARIGIGAFIGAVQAAAQLAQRRLSKRNADGLERWARAATGVASLILPMENRIGRLRLDIPVTVEEVPAPGLASGSTLALRVGGKKVPAARPVWLSVDVSGEDLDRLDIRIAGDPAPYLADRAS
ncbi:MAG: hypothetical protein M0006_07640 [Magnetospirillum sp.]|nr:hypothetical protein [Magnetospirillum sp.]